MARRKALKLSDAREVRRALARITNLVLNDEISTQQANCIIAACNAILNAIRTDDQQTKIDELERLLIKFQEGMAT